MKMGQLIKALASVQHALEHMRADQGVMDDLQQLHATLRSFENLSVAEFCQLCHGLGTPLADDGPDSTPRPISHVETYTQRLSEAGGDAAQFEAVISSMRANKSLKAAEVSEIAQRYVGGTARYAKKSDAYKDIALRFEAHKRAVGRLDAASDIF